LSALVAFSLNLHSVAQDTPDVPAYSQMFILLLLAKMPPIYFWRSRRPPQSNYPPYNVLSDDLAALVRSQKGEKWYFKDDSTYPSE